MCSYEKQGYLLYKLIEELDEGSVNYSKVLFNNKKLNKMHFEYLGKAILENYKNGEIIEVNNLHIILYIKKFYIIIDIDDEYNYNEILFRICINNDLSLCL